MPLWTWTGLKAGTATARWPGRGPDGQAGVYGMPRLDPSHCKPDCQACVACCPTAALSGQGSDVALDYGRCIACQACVEACPEGTLEASFDWAFAVRDRDDLIWHGRESPSAAPRPAPATGAFAKSLHIRHVDAGSCNGCESEIAALNNPFYNLHRLGIFFTPSPRFADALLVTGPVIEAMRAPLQAAYEAMPEPRFVIATGTCAVSGAPFEGGYGGGHGLSPLIPVDVWLPGCPPNPAALIHALLILQDRMPVRVHGGRYEP